MGGTQCYQWFNQFKASTMTTNEETKPIKPSISTNDHICTIHADLSRSPFNCSRDYWGSGYQYRIMPNNFNWKTQHTHHFYKILAVVYQSEEENHVYIKQKLLNHTNVDENFLKKTVTGDKTWVVMSKPRCNCCSTCVGQTWRWCLLYFYAKKRRKINIFKFTVINLLNRLKCWKFWLTKLCSVEFLIRL